MDSLLIFVIAIVFMGIPIHLHLKKLRKQSTHVSSGTGSTGAGIKVSLPTVSCSQCNTPVTKSAIFCSKCGTPLAMYDLKKAPIVDPNLPEDETAPLKPAIDVGSCIGCGSCVSVCPDNALALVNHKAVLPDPALCTGAAKCASVCPTGALVLVRLGSGRKVQVPFVQENFETNIPGLYIVGELGGMALIKHAVNEGRMVIDKLLGKIAPKEGVFDTIIVGAGPAGLSAALSAKKHNLNALTIEAEELASTIRKYPRNKFVMAEPLEIPLYGNLWVQDTSKEALLDVWKTIVQNTGVAIQEHTRCVNIVKQSDGHFAVKTDTDVFSAQTVILAVGKRGTPRKLGVPGEELSKVTYQLIDATEYHDTDVLIVGGGDSALEAAMALSNQGSNRVTMSYRKNSFAGAMARNREALDQAVAKKRIEVLYESNLVRITDTDVVLRLKDGSERTVPNRFTFLMLGGESPNEFLKQMGVDIVTRMLPVV
ncbi:MAG: NAD(P)-binding domain-containing protein [bacterium]|nr:NAD(P)-binding domain-containing protein [bacterium]